MTDPLLPYEETHARRDGPATSKRAARDFKESGNLQGHMARIMEYVNENPGCIPPEIDGPTGLNTHQINKRRADLVRDDLVYIEGDRGGFGCWYPTRKAQA